MDGATLLPYSVPCVNLALARSPHPKARIVLTQGVALQLERNSIATVHFKCFASPAESSDNHLNMCMSLASAECTRSVSRA